MPLNKLDNFIKNTEGRILYVNPNDLDSTDSISNQGNSLAQPFKTIQRALLEAARFSYLKGDNNDITEKTTILLFPGIHYIDNRPGYAIKKVGNDATAVSPGGSETAAPAEFSLTLTSNFDITQSSNILYKFNSIHGGVVVPRGTSVVGLDLRKTKIRPKYVPNPTDVNLERSAIFRITGACYFWQFSIFDGDESTVVYTDSTDFSTNNQSTPTFSHHKLTAFEYADGVNTPTGYTLTDLDMYYAKLSNAFNIASTRDIDQKYPSSLLGFAKQRPEWEIVGAFATDPISLSSIQSGSGGTAGPEITVTTTIPHELTAGTPIKIKGVADSRFNVSTKVQAVISSTQFTYLLSYVPANLTAYPSAANATVTIETDTVGGASPYIFNVSLRSVWGMCGMQADGLKSSGFRSMVVAQFTGVSLQKDDRAFVKYNQSSRLYENIAVTKVTGSQLSSGSASTDTNTVYHLDSGAIYRNGWDSTHIKLVNDAFIQVVSVFAIGYTKHFAGEAGADASITNSNSNFGQNSITASGFKKEAFSKDNNAFITSIIGPKAVPSSETTVDWIAFDVAKTTAVAKTNHLYLYGFTAVDDIPPNILQGYRVGAKINEKIYVPYNGTNYEANVYLTDTFTGGDTTTGTTSSEKIYTVTGQPSSNIFTIGTHKLTTGEKVRIFSNSADLPENIVENTVYYAIVTSSTEIKLASSYTDALNGQAITVYGGDSLKITSRASDKDPGDIGHPIQYDTVNSNWFVHTNAGSDIYTNLIPSLITEPKTEVSYITRTTDSRSLDDKLYKIRVVVPKEAVNSRDPVEGFVIQESSSTDIGSNSYATASSITISDYNYNKNTRFISKCSVSGATITVIAAKSHNLNSGDKVIVTYVTDTSNTTGADNAGYNGTFVVTSIVDAYTFQYTTTDIFGVIHTPGTFNNDTSIRDTLLPRFTRNDLQSNYFIYRNEVIRPYKYNTQDGIYHLYVLNAKNTIQTEFTDFKYNQNVVNLYPQLDRDNLNDNPAPTKSYAKRFPLGEVSTNYLKNSLTKETVDQFLQDFGSGLSIASVSNSSTSATITFDRDHGLAGIVTYSSLTGGSGHTNGTYYNVKLYNENSLSNWNGATAKVVVSGSGAVTSVDIMSPGSGYATGSTLYFDTATAGGIGGASVNSSITIATSGISTAIGNVIQFTGSVTTSDGYHRITSVPARNQISIAKTTGDTVITNDQYALVVGPSITVSSSSYSNGTTTFNCSGAHGLQAGNRFKAIDSSNNNLGDFIVSTRVDYNTFTATTNASISPAYILRHGLSANYAVSDVTGENIGIRDTSIFDNEILTAVSFTSTTQIKVSSPVGGAAITKRFPLGSYIQIDSEIMRISSSTLSGTGNDEITVIRGVLGTSTQTHDNNSLIRKIKPLAIELRRPTILRASNQTFEYLGYGPGNYSTGLPQVQVRTLSETETYLAQAQQRSCGAVIYTGMNSDGDFYIGNKKLSSKTGKEVIFDAPIPTITGENPARLSVVFDEVTVKERILVEGGNSNKVLSQFDGPVTFNNELKITATTTHTAPVIIKDTTESTDKNSGALIIKGGVGIAKTLTVGGNTNVDGTLNITGATTLSSTLGVTAATTLSNTLNVTGATTLSSTLNVTAATTLSNTLNVTGATTLSNTLNVTGATTLNSTLGVSDRIECVTPNADSTGGLRIKANATTGISYLQFTNNAGTSEFANIAVTSGTVTLSGALNVTGDIIAFFTSDQRLKDNITPIPNALDKVLSISGNTFDWNEKSEKEGNDVGVIAQEILEVLPEAVTTRDNGYLAVRYEKLVPLLIEAIKELKEEINELKGVK